MNAAQAERLTVICPVTVAGKIFDIRLRPVLYQGEIWWYNETFDTYWTYDDVEDDMSLEQVTILRAIMQAEREP